VPFGSSLPRSTQPLLDLREAVPEIIGARLQQLALGSELMCGRVDIVREVERGVKCCIAVKEHERVGVGGEVVLLWSRFTVQDNRVPLRFFRAFPFHSTP
jgi:predicted acetyltransferase